jgi:acetyl-CoA carboxylase biotin carboxyl carrier protein
MNLKLEELKKLIGILEEGGVNEFEYEDESSRVRLTFGPTGVVQAAMPMMAPAAVAASPASAAAGAVAAPSDDADAVFVTSPFVGTFYRASSPDAPPFTDAGQTIKPGQVLCIVEAMKLMNEIESDVSGTVLEVLVKNGTSVEFGQKLFKVKKG